MAQRILTGHTIAAVKVPLEDGTTGEVIIRRGDAIPARVVKGELERLKAIGAFDEPAQSTVPLLVAAPVATGAPPVGDQDEDEPDDAKG